MITTLNENLEFLDGLSSRQEWIDRTLQQPTPHTVSFNHYISTPEVSMVSNCKPAFQMPYF